jgi:hypothetical protein
MFSVEHLTLSPQTHVLTYKGIVSTEGRQVGSGTIMSLDVFENLLFLLSRKIKPLRRSARNLS